MDRAGLVGITGGSELRLACSRVLTICFGDVGIEALCALRGEVGVLGRDGRRVDGAERLMGPISMNGSVGIVVVSSLSLDCIALGCVGRGCAGGLAREKRTVAVGCHGCSIKFGKKSSFDTLLCARWSVE